eukprot:1156631-Amphidinium_carterae.1
MEIACAIVWRCLGASRRTVLACRYRPLNALGGYIMTRMDTTSKTKLKSDCAMRLKSQMR